MVSRGAWLRSAWWQRVGKELGDGCGGARVVRGGYISAATVHCALLCKDGAVCVDWLLIEA